VWDLVKDIGGLLAKTPAWLQVRSFFFVLAGCGLAEYWAYQYLQSQYGFTPSPEVFLRSYVSIRILLAGGGLFLVLLLFRIGRRGRSPAAPGRLVTALREHRGLLLYRGAVVAAVATGIVAASRPFAPSKAGTIRVRFLDRPVNFDPQTLAYVVYELNRIQKNWYFEVDFKPFSKSSLRSDQATACDEDRRPLLALAKFAAEDKPMIGITSHSLGDAYFWEHEAKVGVISTADEAAYAPISSYRYLAFCLIVQSMLLHLGQRFGDVPLDSYPGGSESHGGILQSVPTRSAVRPLILGARLSPGEEEMLFNAFGPEYARTCSELLTLAWLDAPRVAANLKEVFGVDR